MRTLTSTFESARRLLSSGNGWMLLLRCSLLSGGEIRITSNPVHVTAGGLNYQACSMGREAPAEELAGSLGRMDLTLPNVSRMPMLYLESDPPEILGQVITWAIAHEDALAAGMLPGLTNRHLVLKATADEGVVRLECGHPAALLRCPGGVYDRNTYPSLVAGAIGGGD